MSNAEDYKASKINQWARKERLSDFVLNKAIQEIREGLVDADLGQGILKKRVALPGRGKRKGSRALIATNLQDRWIFLYGFTKNERENVTAEELEGWQALALDYFKLSNKQLDLLVLKGELLEVLYD